MGLVGLVLSLVKGLAAKIAVGLAVEYQKPSIGPSKGPSNRWPDGRPIQGPGGLRLLVLAIGPSNRP